MKYAIISDIHANLEALRKALGIIDAEHVERNVTNIGILQPETKLADLWFCRERYSLIVITNSSIARDEIGERIRVAIFNS